MAWSQEALTRVRRMRKARRLFKKSPLFAYSILVLEYPDYSYDQFMNDLVVRNPSPKRTGKSYVRNVRKDILQLQQQRVLDAIENRDEETLSKIMCRYYVYQGNMTQPVTFLKYDHAEKQYYVFSVSNRISLRLHNEIIQAGNDLKTHQEFESKINDLLHGAKYVKGRLG